MRGEKRKRRRSRNRTEERRRTGIIVGVLVIEKDMMRGKGQKGRRNSGLKTRKIAIKVMDLKEGKTIAVRR